jgi:CMP-N-acetylneuraminic acid synthetase
MKSISVVINARLSSTRVPQKLVRPFAGSNLLEIALNKLNHMDFFQCRYLAVAEDELKTFAEKFKNIEVLHRSMESVKKGVNPIEITFAHYLNIPTDYVFVFNPCLPLIKIETIKNAYDYFQSTDFPSYTSAIPTREWIFDDEGNSLTNTDPRNATTNIGRVFYKAAHAFHIINKKFFAENGYFWSFIKDDPHLILIPEEEAIDVDNKIEFEFAEFVYKNKKGKDS